MRTAKFNSTDGGLPRHTAGPWDIEDEGDSGVYLELKGDSGSKPIAHIYESYFSEEHEVDAEDAAADKQEYDANARLILKAPELLSALKGLVGSLGSAETQDHRLACREPENCTLCVARRVIEQAS